MITRLDHVLIAAGNLDEAMTLYRERLGLDARFGGRHTGRGTHNAIVRFGLDYLELLSVVDEEELRHAPAKRVRLLDFLSAHQGGLLAYCLATDNIDALAQQFQEKGLDAIGPFDMERTRPDGMVLKWRLLIPGGSAYRQPWPFFIEWALPDAERLTHEVPGTHALPIRQISYVALTVADLAAAEHLYSEQFGLVLANRGAGEEGRVEDMPELAARRLRYQLANCTIDLFSPTGPGPIQDEVNHRGDGVYRIALTAEKLDDVKAWFDQKKIGFAPAVGYPGALAVSPDQTDGTNLLFV